MNLIDGVAVPLVNDRPAFMNDLFALFNGLVGTPMVGQQGEPIVL